MCKLTDLNLSDNPFTSIKATIDQIKHFAPNLRTLTMTLTETADVEYILQQLANLELLNE